jgi:anti-anti-sigma regulatory factor
LLEQLGFDPTAVLLRDPAMLSEQRFLAAFHEEIRHSFGEEAALVLHQVGFLHGLQASLRQAAQHPQPAVETGEFARPPIALRFCVTRSADTALEIRGEWPDRAEQRALRRAPLPPGPKCHLSAGFTSGWLSGCFDADLLAIEEASSETNRSARFVAREPEAWREARNPFALALLERLPFGAFRDLVREQLRAGRPEAPSDRFDSGSAVIHIWGPLMVIPFSNSDEAFRAVELITRDPAARQVSVVVVDLTGAALDEAFGALALEQVVEAVEARGAEVLFAGASPAAGNVIAQLGRRPLFVHKDLPSAIASAFQIADSQRSGA